MSNLSPRDQKFYSLYMSHADHLSTSERLCLMNQWILPPDVIIDSELTETHLATCQVHGEFLESGVLVVP
jgi:hypothetical protein